MGMFTTVVAVLTLAYGILITICALNTADRFAGKPCSKAAVKANNGLIVVGGAMIAFSLSYLACQRVYSNCGNGKDFFMDNSAVFAFAINAVAIVCITLAAIVENEAKKSDGCPNVTSATQAIWIPGIIVLVLGLFVAYTHISLFTGWGAQNLPIWVR